MISGSFVVGREREEKIARFAVVSFQHAGTKDFLSFTRYHRVMSSGERRKTKFKRKSFGKRGKFSCLSLWGMKKRRSRYRSSEKKKKNYVLL